MSANARTQLLTDLQRDLPHTAALLSRHATFTDDLVKAWDHGATASYSKHPLLSLLWSKPTTSRTAMLDGAIAALARHLSPQSASSFTRRLCTTKDFRDATAAMTELLVGGLLARADATVTFVPCSNAKSNDLTAARGGATIHVEVASLNINDGNERTETAMQREFAEWPTSQREIPDALKGRARQHREPGGGYVRFHEHDVRPLGDGSIAKKIQRLTGKKTGQQLRGLGVNRMIVNSFWHEFGVSREVARPTFGESAQHTGYVYAATYGRKGDPILNGFRFDGEDVPMDDVILGPGILQRPNKIAGVAWIFHTGSPVVFERLDSAPHLTDEARALVRDALVHGDDGVSRLR